MNASEAANVRDHAEMQILPYAQQHGIEIDKMGVSKPACVKCTKKLKSHDVAFKNNRDGNDRPCYV